MSTNNYSNLLPIKDKNLIREALTHRSWLNENPANKSQSNERLEFLGDAVLELIVTEHLFQKYPKDQEGTLTTLRASLVRTETLAKIAKILHLGDLLLLSRGEELSGGRENESLLANTFEAIIGAIYLESGKETAYKFVNKYLIPELKDIRKNHLERDSKSILQEKVQSRGIPAPVYKVIKETGPDHDKTFTVAVFVSAKKIATGKGKSKQLAQQQAAKSALEKYRSY